MGMMFRLEKFRRESMPPCHPDFQDGTVWQHWFIQDEDLAKCHLEDIFEKKNYYTVHDLFVRAFSKVGVDAREATTEVSKEMLLAVDKELLELSERIAEANSRGETFDYNAEDCRFYDKDDREEIEAFRPTLLHILNTFDFDNHALVMDWA
jgi:Fe-S-cluster containining protein